MKYKIFKANKYFLIPHGILLILIAPVLAAFSKQEIHLFLNKAHSPFFDIVFKYGTYLGDGIAVPIVGIVLLLFFNFRRALYLIISCAASGLFVEFLKKVFFSDIKRPVAVFRGVADLYLVEGVNVHVYFSFPSGHAATAFGLCCCLAIFSKDRIVKLMLFFLAVMVAYSRVYLSQHFLCDIFVGSVIGTAGAVIFYPLVYTSPVAWLDRSLFSLVKKGGEGADPEGGV